MAGKKTAKKAPVKKVTEEKVDARKVAPSVVVRKLSHKNSFDELCADNPTKDFVYAPKGCSAENLKSSGLVPVKGIDGNTLCVGSRVICEDVGTSRKAEIASAHAEATERINEVKDPKQANSRDKTAQAKKPTA